MEIRNLDIFKPNNSLQLKAGRLLISEPLSNDNFFTRSIVLLTEYRTDGAIGFALNKPSKYHLSDVFKENYKFNPILNYGGPVANDTLHFIHKLGSSIPGAVEILPNLFWGGNFDIIKDMAKKGNLTNDEIRFFIGYSGWTEHQLDEEIENDYWQISEAVNNIPLKLRNVEDWKFMIENLGAEYKSWTNIPENPSMN